MNEETPRAVPKPDTMAVAGFLNEAYHINVGRRDVERERAREARENGASEDLVRYYVQGAADYEQTRLEFLDQAKKHLQENRGVYEQSAVRDANLAGHDIDFGGEHYPAPQSEQPEGAEKQ